MADAAVKCLIEKIGKNKTKKQLLYVGQPVRP